MCIQVWIFKFQTNIKSFKKFRSILESAGVVMGQRSMQIEMKKLHPGLFMKIGPTIGPPHLGVIEFVLDPNRKRNDRDYHSEQPESTGKH